MTNTQSLGTIEATNPVLAVAPLKEETEMLRATDKITALYCRLSVEDLKEDKKGGKEDESNSIQNQKEISLPYTLPEKIPIASEQLEELQCLPIVLPCARRCRVSIARRFASAPIIRCCAAVGGSAALRMRHTPCGCRSAHLVGVQPNHRLSPVSRMWRAQQCHIPQAVCRRANVTRASR